MGAGGRGNLSDGIESGVSPKTSPTIRSKRRRSAKDDLKVLKSLWLNKANGKDHAERLEAFYGPQAEACTPNLPHSSRSCYIGSGFIAFPSASPGTLKGILMYANMVVRVASPPGRAVDA